MVMWSRQHDRSPETHLECDSQIEKILPLEEGAVQEIGRSANDCILIFWWRLKWEKEL